MGLRMDSSLRKPARLTLAWIAIAIACLGVGAYAAWELAGEPDSLWPAAQNWFYDLALVMTALACAIRALAVPENRAPWLLFALGLFAWTLGDYYFYATLVGQRHKAYPSPADLGYLTAIPCFFAAIMLLARERVTTSSRAIWFDGLIGAFAAASAAVALLGPALVGLTNGRVEVVLTNLAYPLGDILIIATLAAVLAVSGVRSAGTLVVIGLGLIVWTAGDGIYLWHTATHNPITNLVDLLWPIGGLIIAVSAALSVRRPLADTREYRPGLAVPLISTFVAVLVLVWDHFRRTQTVSVWLGAATLLLVAARLAVSFRENERLMVTLHGESITDHLTGLGNRRAVMTDLAELLNRPAELIEPHIFALYDLDGFKSYNDTFGHIAGDALLSRLASRLRSSISGIGAPYRLGGDEFCVLVPLGDKRPGAIVELARSALAEHGEGFTIGASGGMVLAPAEASAPTEVLRLADKRLYAEKSQRSTRSGDQTRSFLLGLVHQREPALGVHVDGVTHLSMELGRSLGLGAEELDVLRRAAEMHDIGKIAVPEDVLHKPGPLTEAEWDLMRRHTLIGERMLGATPALAPVGKIVRASHERWDGGGYPDGLAGEEIPLLARIVFVCDAFEAMRAVRSYKGSMSVEDAVRELRDNAGTQFDPSLVERFCDEILPNAINVLEQPSVPDVFPPRDASAPRPS